MIGMDELSEEDKQAVARARRVQRFLSQPFHVAEQFIGLHVSVSQLERQLKDLKVYFMVSTMKYLRISS